MEGIEELEGGEVFGGGFEADEAGGGEDARCEGEDLLERVEGKGVGRIGEDDVKLRGLVLSEVFEDVSFDGAAAGVEVEGGDVLFDGVYRKGGGVYEECFYGASAYGFEAKRA